MKTSLNSILVLLLILVSAGTYAQNFEGKIVYNNKYKSKIPNVTDDQFAAMMGTRQEYFMKGGNYRSSMNGNMMEWQLYRVDDNKLYFKMGTAPTVFWRDASENPDEVQKAEINKGVVTIAGYLCDELILTCKSGVQKFYFSPKVKVDPKSFEKHKFGNWSEVISRTKALPLKSIIETAQFEIESTAGEVTLEKVDASKFELPEGSQLQKSPF